MIGAEYKISLRNADAQTQNEKIGLNMFIHCMNHFSSIPLNIGIGNTSCAAAVAVVGSPGDSSRIHIAGGFHFSLRFGSSRMFTGLDPFYNSMRAAQVDPTLVANPATYDPGGNRQWSNAKAPHCEHAEQVAILTAQSTSESFFRIGVACYLYIDFPPCETCRQWLTNRPELWFISVAEGGTNRDGSVITRDVITAMRQTLRGNLLS